MIDAHRGRFDSGDRGDRLPRPKVSTIEIRRRLGIGFDARQAFESFVTRNLGALEVRITGNVKRSISRDRAIEAKA